MIIYNYWTQNEAGMHDKKHILWYMITFLNNLYTVALRSFWSAIETRRCPAESSQTIPFLMLIKALSKFK